MFTFTRLILLVLFITLVIYAAYIIDYASKLEKIALQSSGEYVCNLHKQEITNLRNLGITLLFISLFLSLYIISRMFPELSKLFSTSWAMMLMIVLLLIVSAWTIAIINKAKNQECNLDTQSVKGFSVAVVTITSIILAIVIGFTVYSLTPYGRASNIVRAVKAGNKLSEFDTLSFV